MTAHDSFKEPRLPAVLAGGAAHDLWLFPENPVLWERADGVFKWDVKGRRFVDLWMGHGALLMGHGFGPVVDAVREAVTRGTHLSGTHRLQIEWAERIVKLVPCAERVRFTASGTEATLLAMRVARAYTGRPRILSLEGHFHGWHDESIAHSISSTHAGLNPFVIQGVLTVSQFAMEPIAGLLARGDVAAVILEPGGGGAGALPWSSDMLRELRELTSRHGALLIFDEVISGFRYAPGGVQALAGVTPDLAALGKIVCGGVPGGALAGSARVMSVFGHGTAAADGDRARIRHSGTFNGNPLSCAAGIAMLDHVADGEAQARARDATATLVQGVNRAAERHGVDVRMFAQSSVFHVMIGAVASGLAVEPSAAALTLYAAHGDRYGLLRNALLQHGIDCHPLHGWMSARHDADVIAMTVDAFEQAFASLHGTSLDLEMHTGG